MATSFTSSAVFEWLRGWSRIIKPITERGETKPIPSLDIFNSILQIIINDKSPTCASEQFEFRNCESFNSSQTCQQKMRSQLININDFIKGEPPVTWFMIQ